MIQQLGLEDTVRFLGRVSQEELVRLYHWCDLFVLTPENVDGAFEGFGLVYLEANACGKPVIGTRGCGAEEPIADGYNGILVPQQDAGATAEAILKLLENSNLYATMRQNALERARQMSFESTVQRVCDVYRSILSKPK